MRAVPLLRNRVILASERELALVIYPAEVLTGAPDGPVVIVPVQDVQPVVAEGASRRNTGQTVESAMEA